MSQPLDAVLHCGGTEIPYRRRGHGPSLLVVRRASEPALDGPGEERLAAAGFRVVAPLVPLPGGPGAADRWMLDLMEGLGLEAPGLILDREAAAILRRFLRRHGERIGVVAILAGEETEEPGGTIARILKGGVEPSGVTGAEPRDDPERCRSGR